MTLLIPRIAITPGEPAGVGPDLVIAIAQKERPSELVAIADPKLLSERAIELGVKIVLRDYDAAAQARPGRAGELIVQAVEMAAPAVAGRTSPVNGKYVVATLERAGKGCLSGEFNAMVTAPVQKSVISESGTPFSGHTEYLAELCGIDQPVMLLCSGNLRVALLTTHLPLSAVPENINAAKIKDVCQILARDLTRLFGITKPRIAALGLNPHAGEDGHLGREEIDIIIPALDQLRSNGLNISGPLPADSAFTRAALEKCDVVLAMYHDQGLPVLKHAGFGGAVNITLGLPIIRTSVDHGTALDIAGTGRADSGSLETALRMAEEFSLRAMQATKSH